MRFIKGTAATFAILVAASLSGTAHAVNFDCQPNEVLELSNRIHVRCSNRPAHAQLNRVYFVAIRNSDANQSARFVRVAIAALLSGKKFRVEIPVKDETNAPGCAAHDCRTPTAFGIAN